MPYRIFIHGIDIVDGGLVVLFFGILSVGPPPPGKFSADALASTCLIAQGAPNNLWVIKLRSPPPQLYEFIQPFSLQIIWKFKK